MEYITAMFELSKRFFFQLLFGIAWIESNKKQPFQIIHYMYI